jgi:hypothetical protein
MTWDPKKLQDWHHRVIDMLIADPTLTAEQISFQLNGNIGPEMITLLRRTDLFRMALEERREQISRMVDQVTAEEITGKLHRLASKTLDSMTGAIEREAATNPVGVSEGMLQTCEQVLKSLGYGRPAAPSEAAQQNTIVLNVSASDIAIAQQRMRAAHARIDTEPARALPDPLAVRAG